ncbi:MAG: ZIP family metal transporter [Planctomycetota bacterium]
MAPETALIAYCACIVVASAAGGLVPVLLRLNHRRMQFGLSFVSGVMLGVAIFHMVPHALMARLGQAPQAGHAHGVLDPLMLAIALGFLAMFFLQRFAHFHQHETPEPACDDPMHGHDGHHHHHHGDAPVGRLTWAGAAVGMGLHSLLEGVALAASMAAAADGEGGAALAGLGTFLVILLHKPFDAMTVATLCHAGGGSRGKVLAVNACFALLVPVGVLLFRAGVPALGGTDVAVPYALAFSAGTFLCIAAADLLPEVHFHRHDRIGLSLALLLGVGLALAVGRLEAAAHDAHAGHDHGAAVDPHAGHDHAGDDHAGHDHAGHKH